MAAEASASEIDDLAARFRRFAEVECPGSSPLYGILAAGVAEDRELLDLAGRVRPGQPPANMLFAAVHHQLLFSDTGHELAGYYPDLAAWPAATDGAFTSFRDFCRRYEQPITDLIGRRVVSTNEVKRCACLMPAFRWIASRDGAERLHLIEVGASAGFNLLWDRYAYDYGDAGRIEAEGAPFVLRCEVRNERGFDLDRPLPVIATRRGIDPFAIDVSDREDRQWLQALIWPEHKERADRLRKLLDWMPGRRPAVIRDDGVKAIKGAIGDVDSNGLVCVFHSFVLNQFSETAGRRSMSSFDRLRPIDRWSGSAWNGTVTPTPSSLMRNAITATTRKGRYWQPVTPTVVGSTGRALEDWVMDINQPAVEKEFGPQASLTKRRLMGGVIIAVFLAFMVVIVTVLGDDPTAQSTSYFGQDDPPVNTPLLVLGLISVVAFAVTVPALIEKWVSRARKSG